MVDYHPSSVDFVHPVTRVMDILGARIEMNVQPTTVVVRRARGASIYRDHTCVQPVRPVLSEHQRAASVLILTNAPHPMVDVRRAVSIRLGLVFVRLRMRQRMRARTVIRVPVRHFVSSLLIHAAHSRVPDDRMASPCAPLTRYRLANINASMHNSVQVLIFRA